VGDLALARKVLETEAAAILALVGRLDHTFDRAIELLRECRGHVVLTGMGKSGIICRKIAATLASPANRGGSFCAETIKGGLATLKARDQQKTIRETGYGTRRINVRETAQRTDSAAETAR
jgi:arabinose-5-phosphate isomerase